MSEDFDVIVVGSGHAGCEAGLAAARMGCRTGIFTLNLDTVALMPCNPSMGGPGKGHLVREIDALGGEMAVNTDRTSVQIRRLNTSKGPAVQALRAQCDKRAYSQAMKLALERQDRLELKQAPVDDLLIEVDRGMPSVVGVRTATGREYFARTVVLTTGTFLRGRIITGDRVHPAGRAGEFPADTLSSSLARAGFKLGRLKTGTPPRVDGRTVDFSLTEIQSGSDEPLFLSYLAHQAFREGRMASANHLCPVAEIGADSWPEGTLWREQLPCHSTTTNVETHRIILDNLDRAPMYNGGITSAGPRYCPSIETKIVRFAEKRAHPIFLEPEGWQTREVYVQGASTSLPEDVQVAMLRSIPALGECEIMRPGYAIEYDYIPGTQVYPSLETKLMRNLYLAGQIIGTTGYEEAGGLGIMAGINAACRALGREPVVLGRDQAYIGVLIDDLVTKEMDEPYRMHTSQAEFRLLLRENNAEERLGPLAFELGLIDEDRHRELEDRRKQIGEVVDRLEGVWISPSDETNKVLEGLGYSRLTRPLRARDFLCRSDGRIAGLQALGLVPPALRQDVAQEAETVVKYSGYVSRQEGEVNRLRKLEGRVIPPNLDYGRIQGMRSESREKLGKVRPRTVGQASRVAGVAPSDISILLVHIERQERGAVAAGHG